MSRSNIVMFPQNGIMQTIYVTPEENKMRITKTQLRKIIKEELEATLGEVGAVGDSREPLDRMSSSNRPVSSYSPKELTMALAEIPQLENNPRYASHLPDHILQWIEDVKAKAAEVG